MYKLILLSILATVSVYANQMACPYDINKDINPQIESCRLYVMKSICEQHGIALWSQTKTHNNIIESDAINTKSSCSDIGIKISNINITNNQIVMSYTSTIESNKVTEVSMEQWNNLNVASSKVNIKGRKLNRIDSTTIADLAMSIQLDSRKIKTALIKIENKTNRIINILLED